MTPTVSNSPPTGFIPVSQRTQEQQDEHNRIVAMMPRFSLTPVTMAKGESVRLTRSWTSAEVIADVGREFVRFHQITGSCFLPGTKVRMADGSNKRIEEVQSGELVVTHKNRTQRVVRPTSRSYTGGVYSVKADGRGEVNCTADHQFLSSASNNDEWIIAQKLDQRNVFHNGEVVRISSLMKADYKENITVHCLEVEEDHSFLANGYTVHNCVGAGGGNALLTLIGTQRLIAENPTKAFIPFWPLNYGRSRLYLGWRTPGEGSMGSTFFKSLTGDGLIASTESGLPQFTTGDGFTLTRSLELQWSDGDSQVVTSYLPSAKPHLIGIAAEIKSVDQIKAAIQNGYPCTFACNNYIGHGQIKGSGVNACVVGSWDTHGPHQQSVHDYWEHPDLGPLYWAQNNWPGSTYPKDPAGGPVCGTWVTEDNVERAMRLDAEVFPLSHLQWFPAQPAVMDYFV